ncbi:helix-turn-helix domain-containing protein [Glycomyces albidus]|uniref:DUF5753 domain-containing protein n=1 Tax=Glycomyces albidus TaxID=2656774 RepID=A0A6L5G1T0_9ACTN|nr:helix-turn-helix transcriptional regulator [Glycomyces albidus]MQM24132.1 hypothetical protein [Glycomyces albidus]
MAARFVQSHLAKLLIHYRELRGLSKTEAMWFLGTSKDIIESYESGERQYMEPHVVEGWLRDYGAPEEVIIQAKEQARWVRFGDPARMQENTPPWFSRFVQLEATATSIDIFEDVYITGLGQTAAYAKGALSASPLLTAETLPKTLALRAQRQTLVLNRDGGAPLMRIIQAEHSITRLRGMPLYEQQLDWLSELNELEEVNIFVLPADGFYPLMGQPFSILSFDDAKEPDVIYQEHLFGSQYEADPSRVDQMRAVFSALLALTITLEEWRESDADR